MKTKLIIIFIFFIIIYFFSGCNNSDGTVDCFPKTTIDATINLNLPQYQNLNNSGGYVETSAVIGQGTRGLIIVRTANEFVVYDRNAPHICPAENTTLFVKDGYLIVCPKDDANWNLLSGEPVNGKSNLPPKKYFSSFNQGANILLIRN